MRVDLPLASGHDSLVVSGMRGSDDDGPKGPLAAPRAGLRDAALSVAVQLYIGVGVSSFPTSLPSALIQYFGPKAATLLRQRVEALCRELDADAPSIADLAEATRAVEERLGRDHPELSADAVRALGWRFSYNNR